MNTIIGADLVKFRSELSLSQQELSLLLFPLITPKAALVKLQKFENKCHDVCDVHPATLLGLRFNILESRKAKQSFKDGSFTFIDLFAGIGGMRLPFQELGGDCVFTSEWDSYPASMYEENYGDKPFGDITKIPASQIPAHDVLLAGFPCQPFSAAGVSKKNSMGRAHGFKDKTQGTLFFDVVRILEYHKPKMFLLENVKNLVSHDGGKTFKIIIDTLTNDLNYKVTWQLIDASAFVPQKRERIYLVGMRQDMPEFKFPEIQPREQRLGDILEKVAIDSKYTVPEGTWKSLQRHADKHKAKGNGFGFGLVNRNSVTRTLSARYYKDGAEILLEQKAARPRRLTPRECARLMGFPDEFKISLSESRAYKCFGNSVVVPVIRHIAKSMVGNYQNSVSNIKKFQIQEVEL
ncbi:DNA (cytosine-5-)-methyltransferase [Bdellovibrio sp. HCB274]|uniref:DNA (cytosine-5-)-methyltransferase n=1 Tax=Bdellovibrio sp. HCB274 TaxID=3394361 RepID=UPI0039B58508